MQPVDNGALLTALDLPASSRVDRRVPKNLLAEQGAPTANDRRKIQDGIEELSWVAASSPPISAFRPSETMCASTWRSPCSRPHCVL